MTELHVLCDGYVREGAELRVGSTVGFVADGNALVVIDPGMVAGTSSILEPLRALGVTPGDITDVVLSHHHPDHTVNVALVPRRAHPRLPGDLRRRPLDRSTGRGVRPVAQHQAHRDAGSHAARHHDAGDDRRRRGRVHTPVVGGRRSCRRSVHAMTPTCFTRTASASWAWSFEIVPGHGPRFVPDERHTALTRTAMTPPKLILILSENWTMTSPRDLPSLVRFAVEAEDAGFDAVMVSEHVVLGPDADSDGLPSNPRDYALARATRIPTTPWPSSLVLLSAVAAATTRLRLVAGAIIPPLRHPLLLAKDLATLDLLSRGTAGRPADRELAPTPSTTRSAFRSDARGALLDEHLAAWDVVVARLAGVVRRDALPLPRRLPRAEAVPPRRADALVRRKLAPRAVGRPHRHVRRRLQPAWAVPSPAGPVERLRDAMAEAGGASTSWRWSAGHAASSPIRRAWPTSDSALSSIPEQVAAGFTSICIKPSQFIDDAGAVGAFCREVVERVSALVG